MKKLLNTLYVTNDDCFLRKKDDAIAAFQGEDQVASIPFHVLESVVLFGHAGCSIPVMRECAVRGVSVVMLDERGRFCARVEGPVSGNVLLRRAQYMKSSDEAYSVALAQRFIAAKLRNSRVVLRRGVRDYGPNEALERASEYLADSCRGVSSASTLDELRGVEGDAAHAYFSAFPSLFRGDAGCLFHGRTRRPPRDPVNSALSFYYALLAKDCASACETVGLDPQIGFLHADRPGRASLALDLMEELRAPLVDRFVLTLFNRGQLTGSDFTRIGEGYRFEDKALKLSLDEWQKRKQQTVAHPFLKEKIKIGLLPYVQANLLAKAVRGELDDYPAFLWR